MTIAAVQPRRSRTADLVLRRATADDADALLDLYEGLGAESRYRRFFRVDPALRRRAEAPHHGRRLLTRLGRLRRRSVRRRGTSRLVVPSIVRRSRRHRR